MSSDSAGGRPLRVGLNLLFMGEGAGGVGRYVTELIGGLLAAEPATELHALIAPWAPQSLRTVAQAERVRWTVVPERLARRPLGIAAEFAGLPALARRRRLDVLHSPGNTGPVWTPGVASVVTLHDLIWLHQGADWNASRIVRLRMRALVGHALRHADRVLTVSHAAAEDIAASFGVAAEHIDVAPGGVRVPAAIPEADAAGVRRELGLRGRRLVLCVAQKRPYKNLAALIRALPDLAGDVTLVLAGAPTPHEQELRELARALSVEERVCFLGWLDDRTLDGLYATSDVFALASLQEGFGLPVLEAMARGLPVACAQIPALEEVADDAALLFDPRDQAQVSAAISRLLDDRELAAELAGRGRQRAASFTWERTGAATLAAYRHAIAARGG